MSMETIRRTEPMQNVNHDLIQLLSVKLDSAARYELYKQDAKGNPEVERLFDELLQEDLRHIQMLRTAIMTQIQKGKWD